MGIHIPSRRNDPRALRLVPRGRVRHARQLMRLSAVAGVTVLAGLALTSISDAAATCGSRRVSSFPCVQFQYQTLNDNADTTFNQLLGITSNGQIAGYFGSGVPADGQGHPNQGYLLTPSNGQYSQSGYQMDNFPGSKQTQVTGLNNSGTLVGFYSTMNNPSMGGDAPVNDNFGFYKLNGKFTKVAFPTSNGSSPPMDQLLGVNNKNVAVGFYTDSAGNNHGYFYSVPTGSFTPIKVPGDVTSDVATGVNDNRDISGFATTSSGATEGFLIHMGTFETINYPGASSTQAFGVNNNDEVVGTYTTGTGDNAQMFGFTLTNEQSPGATNATQVFQTISDPNGQGTTTANGLDACGNVVGFYVDSQGNTDGMLANAPSTKAAGQIASANAAGFRKRPKKHKKHKLPAC
jgi:hypothetical protein